MKRRILLADDSVTIQKVIELTFMDEDYEVRAVSNGDEAVTLLSETNPDFVIADVHMPGANGYQVCRRAKQLRPDRPVLLLVGTFEPFEEGEARAAGADSFLKKPFDSQELLQRVEELMAASAASRTSAPAAAPQAPAPAPPPPAPEPAWSAPTAEWAQTPPPPPAPAPVPEFSAEPAWGNFDLEPEPAAPAAPAAFEQPFDREPSFSLEPDPGYKVEEEPVFTIEENESSFALQEDVFGAPTDLSLDETPQDRYLPEEPAAPAPAGFTWNEEPEPLHFAEPPAPEPAAAAAQPEPEQPQWSLPEPVYPPAAGQPQYEPSPAAAATAAPAAAPAPHADGNGHLSDEDVDRIARRVVQLLGDKTVRDVAWEVIPDMAEVIIRDRLRELEGQVE